MKTTKQQGKETRKKIYDFIVSYIQEKQYPPSYREICEGTGIKSTCGVHDHIHKLVEMGVISMECDKPRTIRVLTDLIE